VFLDVVRFYDVDQSGVFLLSFGLQVLQLLLAPAQQPASN